MQKTKYHPKGHSLLGRILALDWTLPAKTVDQLEGLGVTFMPSAQIVSEKDVPSGMSMACVHWKIPNGNADADRASRKRLEAILKRAEVVCVAWVTNPDGLRSYVTEQPGRGDRSWIRTALSPKPTAADLREILAGIDRTTLTTHQTIERIRAEVASRGMAPTTHQHIYSVLKAK